MRYFSSTSTSSTTISSATAVVTTPTTAVVSSSATSVVSSSATPVVSSSASPVVSSSPATPVVPSAAGPVGNSFSSPGASAALSFVSNSDYWSLNSIWDIPDTGAEAADAVSLEETLLRENLGLSPIFSPMSVDSNLEATLLSSPTPSSSSRHAEPMDTCSAEPSVPVTTSIPVTSSVPVPTLSSPSTTVSPLVVPPPLPVPYLPSTTASVQRIPPPTSFPCPPPISHPRPPLLGSCPSLLGAYSSTVPPPVPTAPPQPIACPHGEGMGKGARTRKNKKKAALLSVTFTSLTSTTTSEPTKPTYAEAAQRPPAPPSQSLPYTERPGVLPTPPPHLLVRQSRSTISKQTVSSSSSYTSTAPRHADTSYTQFPREPISSSSASSSSTSFGKSAKRPAATVPESSAGKRVNRSQCCLCPVAHSYLPLHSE